MGAGNIAYTSGVDISDATVTAIGTAEKDAGVITSPERLKKSQLTVYVDGLNLGTHTSLVMAFYYQHEANGTWHRLTKQNASDNTLDDFPAIIDSSTPANPVYQFPLGSVFGFKTTVAGVGGAGASVRVKVMGRDN